MNHTPFLEASGGNVYLLDFVTKQCQSLEVIQRFLDIGCGTGLFASSLALATGMAPHGTELSESACREASKRIACTLVTGIKLPFPNDYFDLVVAKDVVPMVANKPMWLREVHRVLRSKGKFATYVPSSEDFLEKPLYAFIPGSFDKSTAAYGSAKTFLQSLNEAGLTVEDISRLPLGSVQIDNRYVTKHTSGFFSNTDTDDLDDDRRQGLRGLWRGAQCLASAGVLAHYEWERTAIVGVKT